MYDMSVIIILEALFINAAILGLCIGFVLYGLSGTLKEHIDLIFKKKKGKGENSGNKFG